MRHFSETRKNINNPAFMDNFMIFKKWPLFALKDFYFS